MTHDELFDKIEAIDYWQEHFASRTFLKALRAVVELHRPHHGMGGTVDTDGVCLQCSSRKSEQFYPCPTIQAIEKELK